MGIKERMVTKTMTNTLKLKAVILERGFTQEQIAEMLGMTIATFNYKVNNKSEFKASEIKKLGEILHLTAEELNTIFFADKVE
ncbi:XRE family transcriptional regulator [Eubacterium sp. OM08-24]|nr:XRE family transcriptional regulator [Eubacterium sp. OM08-24]